jgi:hypothetical protein
MTGSTKRRTRTLCEHHRNARVTSDIGLPAVTMLCVKGTAIVACFALGLGLTSAPEMHVHPAGHAGISPTVHSHLSYMRTTRQSGHTQIDDNDDDHSRAIYLTGFCPVMQTHAIFVALAVRALELAPVRAVTRVALIEHRVHDPPIFGATNPRSPPA